MYARAYPWDNRRKNWQETHLLGKNIIEMLAYCEDQSLATGSQICAVTTLGKKGSPVHVVRCQVYLGYQNVVVRGHPI